MRATQGGITRQLEPLTLAMRVLSHCSLAIRSSETGSPLTWARRFGTSVLADVAVTKSLQAPEGVFAAWRPAADLIDAWLWSGWSPDVPSSSRCVPIATSVPSAVEAGYRLGAGTDALPVADPMRPFPPPGRGAGRWVLPLGRTVWPAAAPVIAAGMRRRMLGRRPEPAQVGWGLLGVSMGFGLARLRHHHQRRTRSAWDEKATRRVEIERQAARVRATTRSSIGHDFKKTLLALGYGGDDPAAQRGRQSEARPARVVASSTGGATLFDSCRDLGLWPEPLEHWMVWLSDAQRHQLERLKHRAAADVDVVEVLDAGGSSVTVRLGGTSAELTTPPPPLDALLDPVAAALVLSGFWKLLTMAPTQGGTRPSVAISTGSVDLGAALWYVLRPPQQGRHWNVIGPTMVGTAAFNLALGGGSGRPGAARADEEVPASAATQGLVMILGHYWQDMGRWRYLVITGAAGLWLLGARADVRARPRLLLAELPFVAMTGFAVRGMSNQVRTEADLLGDALRRELAEAVAAARDDGVQDALDAYREDLRIAAAALERLAGRLPEREAVDLERDCDELREWLADEETAPWLAGR